MNDRIKELENLFSKIPKEKQDKYFDNFSKWAIYMGNGIYQWKGILSSNTRELYLIGCLKLEKIPYPEY